MPMDPAVIGSIISSGVNLGNQLYNQIQGGNANQKTRDWNERMMNQQRSWALADWNMQNEYNSPVNQMARYKAAGLNPNLIYGQSQNAPAVRSTESAQPSYGLPPLNISSPVEGFMDTLLRTKQVANMEAQNKVINAQVASLNANTTKTLTQTEAGKFDLGVKQELRDNTIAQANALRESTEATTEQRQASTQFTLSENERREASNAQNLIVAKERVLNMRVQREKDTLSMQLAKRGMSIREAQLKVNQVSLGLRQSLGDVYMDKQAQEINRLQEQLKGVKFDSNLKELDYKLRQQGVTPSSPFWMQMLEASINRENSNPVRGHVYSPNRNSSGSFDYKR